MISKVGPDNILFGTSDYFSRNRCFMILSDSLIVVLCDELKNGNKVNLLFC